MLPVAQARARKNAPRIGPYFRNIRRLEHKTRNCGHLALVTADFGAGLRPGPMAISKGQLTGAISMSHHPSDHERARQERLRAALRENIKRRKSQARGRAGRAIVTPEDDAALQRQKLAADRDPGSDAS
jgi:hypothetical protein